MGDASCSHLFSDAQSAEAVCSVQVQVVLGPADDLFLALPFGVSFKKKRQKDEDETPSFPGNLHKCCRSGRF